MGIFDELLRIFAPRLWEKRRHQAMVAKYEAQIKGIQELGRSINICVVGGDTWSAIREIGEVCRVIFNIIEADNRWEVWPQFAAHHLEPIHRWLSVYSRLQASNAELASTPLTESAAKMLPHFRERLDSFYEQYHAGDIAALATADAEISTADPRTRIPSKTKESADASLAALEKAYSHVCQMQNSLYGYRDVISDDTAKVIKSIISTVGQVRQSLFSTGDWSAMEPFLAWYLKPFERMLALYVRLQSRRVKMAKDVIEDVHMRMLPLFKNGMVAFHNQLHVHDIAQLQATEAELAAAARPAVRAKTEAAAEVELAADTKG